MGGGGGGGEARSGIPMTKKRFARLKLRMLHNVQIPETNLVVDHTGC